MRDSANGGFAARREISRRFPPSHSCEGRNFRRRKAAGNCTFVRLSARRFLPSQEWDGGCTLEQGRKSKAPPFRLSPEWRCF
ncbi:MAG: hypothetical protein ACR2QC_03250 [Gammaproteobacteria bacterium]